MYSILVYYSRFINWHNPFDYSLSVIHIKYGNKTTLWATLTNKHQLNLQFWEYRALVVVVVFYNYPYSHAILAKKFNNILQQTTKPKPNSVIVGIFSFFIIIWIYLQKKLFACKIVHILLLFNLQNFCQFGLNVWSINKISFTSCIPFFFSLFKIDAHLAKRTFK